MRKECDSSDKKKKWELINENYVDNEDNIKDKKWK